MSFYTILSGVDLDSIGKEHWVKNLEEIANKPRLVIKRIGENLKTRSAGGKGGAEGFVELVIWQSQDRSSNQNNGIAIQRNRLVMCQ